jgi:prevent-host-death family protein
MRSFSIREAKDKFPALVKAARGGETSILTYHGTPVAKIAPLQEGGKVAPSREAELQDGDKRPERSDLPTFEQALLSLPHALDF